MDKNRSNSEDEQIKKTTNSFLQKISPSKENLIPILQALQTGLGYIPQAAMKEVASFLGIPSGEIFGVVTFYNQFRLIPPGKHSIKVCLGTACHVKGGNIILEEWERRLSIKEGEVTDDREFSLDRVACVGCCALAPVVLADDEVHGNMSPSAVNGILLNFDLKKPKEGKANGNEK